MGKQIEVSDRVKELREQMPERGAYEAIARMTNYARGTIQSMFLGRRTMAQKVLDAAELYVQTINPTNENN